MVGETKTGRTLSVWKGNKGNLFALAISPDSCTLASGGQDQTVRLWDVGSGEELARWEAHTDSVTAVTFSPNGDTLATSGDDGTSSQWNIPFIQKELAVLELGW